MVVDRWRQLVSGKPSSLSERGVFALLTAVSFAYKAAIVVRNFAYNSGVMPARKVPLPVVSVGNITAGGTGKTPIVIELARIFSKKGVRAAVITRGYKRREAKTADEPAVIKENCPDCRVVINSDRFMGALEASVEFTTGGVLILDDGFQHRRLSRDLDILAIDATCPFGCGRVLPAGLLREPLKGVKRANAAVITRCRLVDKTTVEQIIERLTGLNPDIEIFKSDFRCSGIQLFNGSQLDMDCLKGKKCFAFCGIGNPSSFFESLGKYGLSSLETTIYQDHHHYNAEDVNYILTKAVDFDIILTTEKDFVKLKPLTAGEFEEKLGFVKLEMDFYGEKKRFEQMACRELPAK